MFRKNLALLVIILMLSVFVSNSWALGDQNALRKGGRGVANVCTSFFEVGKGIDEEFNNNGVFNAATYGFAKGLTKTAIRFGVGVYEAATFLMPPYGPVLKDPEFFLGKDLDEKYPVRSGISGIVEGHKE